MPAMTGYAMPLASQLGLAGPPDAVGVPHTVTTSPHVTAASKSGPVMNTPATNMSTVFQGTASNLIGLSGIIFGLLVGAFFLLI